MNPYWAIFRIRFINSLQYRAAALGGLATQFAWGFMEILAFSAFYRANPTAFPMEFTHVVSYIWMQQAFLAVFMNWFLEAEIFDSIASGGIAYELARPVDIYWRWSCHSVASRLARASLRCLPVLAVAFCLPEPLRMHLPANLGRFGLFLFSSVLSLGVVVAFSMLIYISIFYTLSPIGMRTIFSMLADFLSGSILPLPFFPAPFRAIAELSPFAAMQNTPLRIYSGNIAGMGVVKSLGLQVFWLIVLLFAGRLWMKSTLSKIVIQGG